MCVPDRKKKEATSSSDQSQSNRTSQNGIVGGSAPQTSSSAASRKKTEGQNEINPPMNRTLRPRKLTIPTKNAGAVVAAAAGKLALAPEKERVVGQKRKQTKQVYVPKTLDGGQPSSALAGAMIV